MNTEVVHFCSIFLAFAPVTESAVKFNIWDVVSVVLSLGLIIMSSDEIDSLGLFTVGFKTLLSYIMSV